MSLRDTLSAWLHYQGPPVPTTGVPAAPAALTSPAMRAEVERRHRVLRSRLVALELDAALERLDDESKGGDDA